MNGPSNHVDKAAAKFPRWIALAHAEDVRHMRFVLFMTALLALLLWQTRWPSLRPGLGVLIIGQSAAALVVLRHRTQLVARLRELSSRNAADDEVLSWLKAEETYIKRSYLLESFLRAAGFVVLAYGFWAVTGRFWVAFALGVLYPVIVYFGMTRATIQRRLRGIDKQRAELR